MPITSQLREEAAHLADHRPLEILERAQEAVSRTKFARIRKNTAPANTEQEKSYLFALGRYVTLKLILQRERKKDWSNRDFCYSSQTETDMEHWRKEMDRIEFCWSN